MRAIRKGVKEYGVSYKKKTDSKDPYIPKAAAPVSVCTDCRHVYMNKRWYADNGVYESVIKTRGSTETICPACRKIRDKFPGGVLTLNGAAAAAFRDDLMNLIKNEERKARGINPLERVMSIEENGRGDIIINTTNEKLAQRLGRAVKKAFHGDVTYRWSHDNKLVRVDWQAEAA